MTAIYLVTFIMSAVLICKWTLSHYDDNDFTYWFSCSLRSLCEKMVKQKHGTKVRVEDKYRANETFLMFGCSSIDRIEKKSNGPGGCVMKEKCVGNNLMHNFATTALTSDVVE